MALSLILLPVGACLALAWCWRRAYVRRGQQARLRAEALIRVHVAGMQARQRLALYRALAHQAIQAEVRQARRDPERRWNPYD